MRVQPVKQDGRDFCFARCAQHATPPGIEVLGSRPEHECDGGSRVIPEVLAKRHSRRRGQSSAAFAHERHHWSGFAVLRNPRLCGTRHSRPAARTLVRDECLQGAASDGPPAGSKRDRWMAGSSSLHRAFPRVVGRDAGWLPGVDRGALVPRIPGEVGLAGDDSVCSQFSEGLGCFVLLGPRSRRRWIRYGLADLETGRNACRPRPCERGLLQPELWCPVALTAGVATRLNGCGTPSRRSRGSTAGTASAAPPPAPPPLVCTAQRRLAESPMPPAGAPGALPRARPRPGTRRADRHRCPAVAFPSRRSRRARSAAEREPGPGARSGCAGTPGSSSSCSRDREGDVQEDVADVVGRQRMEIAGARGSEL